MVIGTVLIIHAVLGGILTLFGKTFLVPHLDVGGMVEAEYFLSTLLQAHATIIALIVTVGIGQTLREFEGRRLWAGVSDLENRSGVFVMAVLISALMIDSIGLLRIGAECVEEECLPLFQATVGHAALVGIIGAVLAIVTLIFSQVEGRSAYLRAQKTNRILKKLTAEGTALEQRDGAVLASMLVQEALSRNDPASAAALVLVIFEDLAEASDSVKFLLRDINCMAQNVTQPVRRELLLSLSRSNLSANIKTRLGFALRHQRQ